LASLPALRHGRLIWAIVKDRRGFRKERPAIVLTPTAEIAKDQPIVVMAVTTTFGEPPPAHHVLLPWNADPRRVGTRLRQRSAAVVTWLDTLYPDEIIDFKGDVPPGIMEDLQRRLSEL
jgi:mRNA-degrading endonuclease toxin of MazEF toxin-antitoxin module